MTDPRFLAGAASDVGRVRGMNEDAYVVTDRVFAVADGMGGHLAGEVASAMAADGLRQLSGQVSTDEAVNAVIAANKAILERSRTDASHRGMGTTLTGLALVHNGVDDRLAVVNVGDSRTYRLRAGTLRQVSIDHSYVQELVAAGQISAQEARVHPQRNIVTRALGIEAAVGIDVWTLPIVRGDRYLVCSDGLVDEVTDEAILDALCDFADPQQAATELIRLANSAGGRDNTTVVVLDVMDGLDPSTVSDEEDLRTYITVRGTDERESEDDTAEGGTGPGNYVDPLDGALADALTDSSNPPTDLTAALLGHLGDPTGETFTTEDDTPATAERRRRSRERANQRFIVIGAIVALVAVLLVVLTAVLRDDSKSPPTPTVSIPDDSAFVSDPGVDPAMNAGADTLVEPAATEN